MAHHSGADVWDAILIPSSQEYSTHDASCHPSTVMDLETINSNFFFFEKQISCRETLVARRAETFPQHSAP